MAGPFPPGQPYPGQPYPGQPYPVNYPGSYPGPLPPPVNLGKPQGPRPALWWGLGALVLVGALVAALVLIGGNRSGSGAGAFTDSASTSAIQGYLTALSDADTEVVARNNACGMFDAIKERKSDLALARLASDAFRKQFSRAEVTSIDKVVLSSSYQAQALFTMKVAPAPGSRTAREEQQGVAQLLRVDDQILVCSYLLRTAAQY